MPIYIKIFDSPRSKILPDAKGMTTISLIKYHNSLFSVFVGGNIIGIKDAIDGIKNDEVWIEFGGNIFSNFLILFLLVGHGNSIYLDCHNSALEYQSGKRLRYYLNAIYLKFVRFIGVKIIVHNKSLLWQFPEAKLVHTPFPNIENVPFRSRKNDVIFLCSLNEDEPLSLIYGVALALDSIGLSVVVTGDPKKAGDHPIKGFMFSEFISHPDYLFELQNSKVAVCLTTRSRTLLFAAREAIVLEVPCIINESQTNRDFYGESCSYVSLDEALIFKLVKEELEKNEY